MDLKELDLVDPHTHWYYQSKSRFLDRALPRTTATFGRVMDVGAGSGFFSEMMVTSGRAQTAICVDPNYSAEEVRDDSTFMKVIQATDDQIRSANLFLFIDVLEHVQDDLALLQNYVDKASHGAIFAISVPAFQSLWSNHDIFLEHYRRYRLPEISRVATSAGLRIILTEYWFSSLFPLVYLYRRLKRESAEVKSDMIQPRPTINQALRTACRVDTFLPTRRLMGLSAFVLAEKCCD